MGFWRIASHWPKAHIYEGWLTACICCTLLIWVQQQGFTGFRLLPHVHSFFSWYWALLCTYAPLCWAMYSRFWSLYWPHVKPSRAKFRPWIDLGLCRPLRTYPDLSLHTCNLFGRWFVCLLFCDVLLVLRLCLFFVPVSADSGKLIKFADSRCAQCNDSSWAAANSNDKTFCTVGSTWLRS